MAPVCALVMKRRAVLRGVRSSMRPHAGPNRATDRGDRKPTMATVWKPPVAQAGPSGQIDSKVLRWQSFVILYGCTFDHGQGQWQCKPP